MQQINLHKKIDEFVTAGIKTAESSAVAKTIIASNFDARDYFYNKLDETWMSWLTGNGFLTTLNTPADDKTRYSFRMPELNYLESVVSKIPDEVTSVILEVDVVNNFNPEVVDRFTRLAESLSGSNLKEVVKKMHDENWVSLMQKFNNWAYSYEKISESLINEGDIESLLLLADILLSVREEREEVRSNPFVLGHLGDVSILDYLTRLEGNDAEKAFIFVLEKLREIIGKATKDNGEEKIFKIEEPYYFFDVDFFTLELGGKRSISYRDDIENFMAVVVALTRKVLSNHCANAKKSNELYSHIDSLPDSWSAWRLRLFALSICPDSLIEQAEVKLNRLFDVMSEGKSYYEIESGTEYKKTLAEVFPSTRGDFKKSYIENIFKYFNPKNFSEDDEQAWRKRDALQLLKMISAWVKDEKRSIEVFGESYLSEKIPDPSPTITMSSGFARRIVDQSPIKLSDLPVPEVIKLLKTELRPSVLNQKYKTDSMFSPRSVEGVGNELRDDIQKRVDEYLEHVNGFFSVDDIYAHYTYSVLQGFENVFRDKGDFSSLLWINLLHLISEIENTELPEVEKETRHFLTDWRSVRRVNANILKFSLANEFIKDKFFLENRVEILSSLASLLTCDDPTPDNEKEKYGDLFTVAINSVRGVAYQALIQFTYDDGEELKKDVKEVLEKLISENSSQAVWFVIGHYLASLYFRDRKWVVSKLPQIFRKENKVQFFAAWEGYLISSVYKELFDEVQDYYAFALTKNKDEYPERKDRAKDLDEAVGVHLALAYNHFEEVTLDHPLIKQLLEKSDAYKQGEFVSHIGRVFISSNNQKPTESDIAKSLLLWDWLLENESTESKVFSEFGFWINRDRDVIEISELVPRFAKTMERSGGVLEYDYNLKQKLSEFANVDPESTLTILEKFLLEGTLVNRDRMWMSMDTARVEVFKILYKANSERTTRLINDLWAHPNGGRHFWILGEVLKD